MHERRAGNDVVIEPVNQYFDPSIGNRHICDKLSVQHLNAFNFSHVRNIEIVARPRCISHIYIYIYQTGSLASAL